jgi:formate-dependent phosphoribosylglycinamide formyltransferase (GAR transformylase)
LIRKRAVNVQQKQRLLILASKLGYQTRGFIETAQRVGAEIALGTDRCHQLDDPWNDRAWPLEFSEPEAAAAEIVARAHDVPIVAILALGDRAPLAAALAARVLGLRYNTPESVANCRSKLRQREVLAAAGVSVPGFFSFALADSLDAILPRVKFPCVVKPLRLSASQGVIRADNAAELRAAVARVRALVESPEVQVTREAELDRVLVEEYVPGAEFAVEGLLDRGELRILAVFDKPDALEGPYFEETIYVTPSRLATSAQAELVACAHRTVAALGLTHGPIHAEFRWNERGAWVLECAPRPIGGLCARTLRFGAAQMPLEELLVRHALGLLGSDAERESEAAAVMMIPVPASGILDEVEGLERARAVAHIEAIEITARLRDRVVAWPEGASYLGFIFARAAKPAEAEAAVRAAYAQLHFKLIAELPVEHPATGRLPVRGYGEGS